MRTYTYTHAQWNGHLVYALACNRFAILVRNQLVPLVFAKALRAKHIKRANRGSSSSSESATATAELGTNIIGLDIERLVAFCASHLGLVADSIFVIGACMVIGFILGTIPLIAGISGMLVFVGMDFYNIRWYASAQQGLMGARDGRTAIVTEALSGIRQIKFSAHEKLWEKKIGSARTEEMKWIKRVFWAQALLKVAATSMPAVLAILTFATYGLLVGTPSAADVFGEFGGQWYSLVW